MEIFWILQISKVCAKMKNGVEKRNSKLDSKNTNDEKNI